MKESSARVLAPRTSTGVLGFPDDDALPGLAQNLGHIGQVVLRVGIGGGKLLDVLEQLRHGENVEAGVDLVNLFLGGAGGLFFDDGLDFRALRAFLRTTRP